MKPSFRNIYAFAAVLSLTACVNDDTDFGDVIIDSQFEPVAIAFSNEPAADAEETIPAGDNDYVENNTFAYTVTITYSKDGAQLTGATSAVTATVDGAHVTVRSVGRSVHYIVRGESNNGSLKIYNTNKFQLTLDGVTLHNPNGAAINNQCGKSLYLVLAEGSNNTLSCGASAQTIVGEDLKGAVFSEGQIILSGSGMLTVESNYRNGIATDDYLIVRPGNIVNVSSTAGNAIKANDGVEIRGSALNLYTNAAGSKGINSESDITVSGGRTTVVVDSDYLINEVDTTSSAAIKCDSTTYIRGGRVLLKSNGKGCRGINSNFGINISGGEIKVVTTGIAEVSTPYALKSDCDINVTGGSVYLYSSHGAVTKVAEGYNFVYSPGWKSKIERGRWFFEIDY